MKTSKRLPDFCLAGASILPLISPASAAPKKPDPVFPPYYTAHEAIPDANNLQLLNSTSICGKSDVLEGEYTIFDSNSGKTYTVLIGPANHYDPVIDFFSDKRKPVKLDKHRREQIQDKATYYLEVAANVCNAFRKKKSEPPAVAPQRLPLPGMFMSYLTDRFKLRT